MGKSGHVARKIASTLASTGTPAFFLHPGEASHGDLGMVTAGDVVLAISWSGETPELRPVINFCTRFGAPLIAMSSDPTSALADAADIALILPVAEEACQNTRAPTTSTTMQLAFGDALAIALLEARGFSAADFRNFHPGGKLGAQLITVADLMARGDNLPKVRLTATVYDAIVEITRTRYGGVAVVDENDLLIGAFHRRRLAPGASRCRPDRTGYAAHEPRAGVRASPPAGDRSIAGDERASATDTVDFRLRGRSLGRGCPHARFSPRRDRLTHERRRRVANGLFAAVAFPSIAPPPCQTRTP